MNAIKSEVSAGTAESVPGDSSSDWHSRLRGVNGRAAGLRPAPVKSALKFTVVHRVPGRLRLRVSDFRHSFRQASACLDKLADFEGVRSIRCSAWCASAAIDYDPLSLSEKQLLKQVRRLRYGPDTELETAASVPVLKESKLISWLRKLLFVFHESLPAGLQLALGVLAFALPVLRVPAALSRAIVLASTAPIAVRAARSLLDERKVGIDALDGMAASLMIINGRLVEAGFMTALIALGELIREKTSRRCEQMVSDLLGLSGRSAWLIRANKRICVAADEVKPGDVVVVYPGDMVPVDGTVIRGDAAIDQSQLTGESLPVEVKAGDRVFAATAAVEGKIYVRCEASGADTRAGMVLNCVENAPIHETHIHNYAAQIADRAVLPIFLAAGACFCLTRDVSRVMSMLIMDFCTGIRIAAPTAVLASMQRAGRHGILIKNGAALEKLASVTAVVFDKTGTLTSGEPRVEQVSRFNGLAESEVLSFAAAVEMRLHHPAARAIVRAAQAQGLAIPERDGSTFIRGMGAKSRVGHREVIVGSKKMMNAEGIEIDETRESELQAKTLGESVTFVAVDGKVAGLIRYRDRLRPEVLPAIKELRKLGIKKLVMATGDTDEAARRIAERCAIRDVRSRAFPEDKAALVKQLKEAGHIVAVIGDGINDSPALAYADVAISLHGATEAARSSADVVLTDDNLARLPEAIRIARSAIALVKQNMAMAVVPNVAGLGLAAVGAIGPAGATLLNNGSAIAAAINSLRPLYSSDWSKDDAAPVI